MTETIFPVTINEVITHLDNIVIESEGTSSRRGYFPAMYNRVTRKVKECIEAGVFDDNERMERFDVIFANRYLEAYYAYAQNQPCSESWKITFEAAKKWTPLVIQHLIASMNAHISLDLGIAAAETQSQNLPSLKNDFDKVNDILDSLIDEVEAELREIFHPLVTFDKLTRNVYHKVAHVGIIKVRAQAWLIAEEYVKLESSEERQLYIKNLDKRVAKIGKRVLYPPVTTRILMSKIKLYEQGTILDKLKVLNR